MTQLQLVESDGTSTIGSMSWADFEKLKIQYFNFVIEWNIRFYDEEDIRVSYAAVYMTCYSIRRWREPTNFVLDDWRFKPRPFAIVTPPTTASQAVFRTWASDSELQDETLTDIGHCLSHSHSGKALGIERTFVVDGKFSRNDKVFDPILQGIEAASENESVALNKLRVAFETGLDKEWTGRDVRIRLRQSNLNLTTPSTDRSTTDYSVTEANRQPSNLETNLRLAIDRGVDRIYKLTGTTGLHTQYRIVPDRKAKQTFSAFLLAVLSAVAGTVVEDILLMRILERRGIVAGDFHLMSKILRYAFLVSLVWVDLLPLTFFVAEESSRGKWKANGLRAFVHTHHATGSFKNGTRTHPEGHGLILALETWRVNPRHDHRLRVAIAFLVVGVAVHILVLGHRAFGVILKKAILLQTEIPAKEIKQL